MPSFRHDIGAWARTAFEVLDSHPGHDSLGVPTWHYGHEPPNPFATAIAKYFRNATREAILLEWIETGEDLFRLVRNVLIHEIGHHFGLSDADIARLEESED